MIISANHELFHTLHQLSRLLTKETNQALQPFDLYSAQWAVIYTLHTKGAMTQTELRDYLAVEAPPLTRNVQRLVKKEIVKQVPGNDKRSKTIELTAYAKREYPEWEKAVVQANEQMLAHIPKRSRDSLEHTLKEWIASISLPKE